MKKHLSLFLYFTATIALALATAATTEPLASKLISVDQLASQLADPDVVVLQVAPLRAEYEREHIPGARFLWIGWLTQSTPEASTEPAPVADIKKTLEKLGIGNRSRIVLYYTNGMLAPTCRIFVTLAYVGLGERTAILNGGLEEWKANGKPVSNETPAIHKTKLKISPDPQVFYEAKEILQNLHSTELTIVDVRPPAFYEGKSGSPRAGHIPGAKNLPLAKLYDEKTYKFLPKEKIVEEFAKAGIVQNKKVIALCGSGNTASILYFLCREEGYPVALYDGSMEQWANNFSLPMEKTEPQP